MCAGHFFGIKFCFEASEWPSLAHALREICAQLTSGHRFQLGVRLRHGQGQRTQVQFIATRCWRRLAAPHCSRVRRWSPMHLPGVVGLRVSQFWRPGLGIPKSCLTSTPSYHYNFFWNVWAFLILGQKVTQNCTGKMDCTGKTKIWNSTTWAGRLGQLRKAGLRGGPQTGTAT